MLNEMCSCLDAYVVVIWWKTLDKTIKEEIIKNYCLEEDSDITFFSHNEQIEQHPYQAMEELRDYFVNHEIGLNDQLEHYNKPTNFQGGTASNTGYFKHKIFLILEKY